MGHGAELSAVSSCCSFVGVKIDGVGWVARSAVAFVYGDEVTEEQLLDKLKVETLLDNLL